MGTASTKKFFKNVLGTLTEEAALTTSAGAGDADRIPALNADGVLDLTITNGTAVSTGAGDAGKLAALDAAGLLSVSMIPPSAGAPTLAFTDLSDGPGTISPGLLLVGKADGTGVEFLAQNDFYSYVLAEDPDAIVVNTFSANAAGIGGIPPLGAARFLASYNPASDTAGGDITASATSAGYAGTASIGLSASSTGGVFEVALTKSASPTFAMYGFDVTASDTNARLTVDGTSYAAVKAIQVKVGEDTHYWPLFGGADAGPAPAPSMAFTDLSDAPGTIVPLGLVVGNGSGDGLVMSDLVQVSSDTVLFQAAAITFLVTDGSGGNVNLQAGSGTGIAGGNLSLVAGYGTGANGGNVNISAGYSDGGTPGVVSLAGSALLINYVPAIATQEVVVPLVGTMTFTHGLLTGFTPA